MRLLFTTLLSVSLLGAALGATSCVGRCGENDYTTGCQCNVLCSDYGDCCSDFEDLCNTCADRCGDSYVDTAPCHCNSECSTHGNCCPDYVALCDGGGSTGVVNPGTATDQEILDLSEELYALDSNNVGGEVVINMQGTVFRSYRDSAPEPLFTSAPELTGETYVLFEALRDNYVRAESSAEDDTPEEQAEVAAFLDVAMATPLMVKLDEFMTTKELLTGTLRENIEEIWFTLYKRGSQEGSSGFEHSFMGEIDGSDLGGFHNWVSFLREEELGTANYLGYYEYSDLGDGSYVFTNSFTWYGAEKPKGGYYIGTSPEYDLAVFTLCFFTRPNEQCQVKANGVQHFIQTWEESYNGKILVGSAYPGV